MVHHGLVGVRDGDLAQCIVAREVCGVETHFQGRHVVDDHLKIGRVCRIPTARTAIMVHDNYV